MLGVPVNSTIKRVKEDGRVESTLKRSELWEVQTPQVGDTWRLTSATSALKSETGNPKP